MSTYVRPTPVRITVAYIDEAEQSDDRLRDIARGLENLLRAAGISLHRADYDQASYLYPMNIDKIAVGDVFSPSANWANPQGFLDPHSEHASRHLPSLPIHGAVSGGVRPQANAAMANFPGGRTGIRGNQPGSEPGPQLFAVLAAE